MDDPNTRMVLHACLNSENEVAAATDTDVLVLMMCVYSHSLNICKRSFRYEKGKYVNMKRIYSYCHTKTK